MKTRFGTGAIRVAGALILLLLTDARLCAQDPHGEGPEAGRVLAAQLRSLKPEENSRWSGTLNITTRDQPPVSIPITCQVTVDTSSWKVVYTTTPVASRAAEQLTVIHSTNGPNQYLYAQASADGALGEPKSLAGAATEAPLAGSDFWLSELGLEFYHWPRQNQLKTAMRRGQPCYVLESVNPDAKPGGAARVKTYIDTESGQPILAEAFGTNDKLLKEFSLGSIIKVNGRWQPKNLEISNPVKKSRTTLEFNTEAK